MKKLLILLLALAVLPFNAGLAEERMLGVYQMPEEIREKRACILRWRRLRSRQRRNICAS
jgi:hypothetical protein